LVGECLTGAKSVR